MKDSGIAFFNENTGFKPRNIRIIRSWLFNAIIAEEKSPGDISYIFCDDSHLLEMNIKYLKHDTLTDIITFDYTEGSVVSGDIFISIERVKENAKLYSKSFTDELNRVMVHGVLHLCGYKDKSPKDEALMRKKEDEYLSLFPNTGNPS
ncbi:MAG: rRNA maturation RNase YbeY [Lentimicrobium sp.]|nr:rRNA maturation RNase YbeY [Lentimicrobium sp.]